MDATDQPNDRGIRCVHLHMERAHTIGFIVTAKTSTADIPAEYENNFAL